MAGKEERLLRVGVLGCGAIAQAAHLESCVKARNAELYAVCDAAPDLLDWARAAYRPRKAFSSYEAMLEDPGLEAVIVATADAFHVPASKQALLAGKHVLCEKPMALSVEEAEDLSATVRASGRLFQLGHMKRFDAGIESARDFIRGGMGEMLALKAWYCDSTHRYAMTDATQPVLISSPAARRPPEDPKRDLNRYYMLAHGSHLVDTARFLCGEIVEVDARFSERFGARCWFAAISFASGALGHLDLTVAVRMDWHEGFHIYGERGSVIGKTYNPWFFKSSDVEIFHEDQAAVTRVLGADGHFYRRQLEAFAGAVLHDKPSHGAGIDDGVASVRAMAAITQSARTRRPVRLREVQGAV